MLDRSMTKAIELDAYGDVAVNFEFPRGYRLSGTVRRAGAPVPFVDVKALPLEAQNLVAVAGETSRSGQYVIDGMPSGKYSLVIEGGRTTTIDIRGDRSLDFDLPENVVSGVTLDGQTGDALSDVHMEIRPAAGNASRTKLEARTDHHGRYSLVGLDAGAYWLSAYKLGYDLVDQQIQVSDSVSDVTTRLMPTDGIVVTVRDAVTRSPLRQIYVAGKVDQADGNLLEMMLDDLGTARLPPAFRGRTLVVWSLGYQVAEVVHWNGAALDLYLSPDSG
jgi:Carboxypeptidase regulatory-like domain